MYLWGSVSIYSLTNPGSVHADGCAPSRERICLHGPLRYAHKLPRQYQPVAFALIRRGRAAGFVCPNPDLPAAKIQITPRPANEVNRDLSCTGGALVAKSSITRATSPGNIEKAQTGDLTAAYPTSSGKHTCCRERASETTPGCD